MLPPAGWVLGESPQEFDGARIGLTGEIQEVRVRSPSPENTYTTFALADGQARAMVFSRGTLSVDAVRRLQPAP